MKPEGSAVIVDHAKDENNDGAADIKDVTLFPTKTEASRATGSSSMMMA